MNDPSVFPLREVERTAWARQAIGDPDAALERASVDAGFRSYWRTTGASESRILMDSPPDREDVRPWLRVRDQIGRASCRERV